MHLSKKPQKQTHVVTLFDLYISNTEYLQEKITHISQSLSINNYMCASKLLDLMG